jgi:uncharacterized protein YdaU (DUF1376 family)
VSDFYKMDPSAWDYGTASLSLEEEAAYLRIVNAIHKHRQPVPANDRILSGMFRCSTRKARALLDALVAAGKLTVEGGKIINERAVADLVHRGFVSVSRAESGAKGGRTTSERSRKPLENQEPDAAIAFARREEKRRDTVEANASTDGDAVDAEDFAKQLFDRGVAFLARHGTPEGKARGIIGKWRKAYTDTDIFDAFARCSKQGAVEPISWITAALTGKAKGNGNERSAKGASKLAAFLGGASETPGMDWGQDCNPPRALLARG